MFPLKEIEDFVRNNVTDNIITHDFFHFKRVAIGARWFVKILNGSEDEQELAYIAGLLHDCVRPDTEKVDHAIASAEKAREILKGFDIDPGVIEKIIQAIRDHRKPVEWTSPLHQSVYLADKILEQMGYYVAFRRCMYVGECRDYTEMSFEQSVESHFEYRLKKFDFSKFPTMFQHMARERLKPAIGFHEAFKRREEWAVKLAKFCYDVGRNKSMGMDKAIRNFSTSSEKSELYKKWTIEYIDGNRFEEFKKMIRHHS